MPVPTPSELSEAAGRLAGLAARDRLEALALYPEAVAELRGLAARLEEAPGSAPLSEPRWSLAELLAGSAAALEALGETAESGESEASDRERLAELSREIAELAGPLAGLEPEFYREARAALLELSERLGRESGPPADDSPLALALASLSSLAGGSSEALEALGEAAEERQELANAYRSELAELESEARAAGERLSEAPGLYGGRLRLLGQELRARGESLEEARITEVIAGSLEAREALGYLLRRAGELAEGLGNRDERSREASSRRAEYALEALRAAAAPEREQEIAAEAISPELASIDWLAEELRAERERRRVAEEREAAAARELANVSGTLEAERARRAAAEEVAGREGSPRRLAAELFQRLNNDAPSGRDGEAWELAASELHDLASPEGWRALRERLASELSELHAELGWSRAERLRADWLEVASEALAGSLPSLLEIAQDAEED